MSAVSFADSGTSGAAPAFKLGDAVAVYNAIQGLKAVKTEIAVAAKILAIEKWARPHAIQYMEGREKIAAKLGTKIGDLRWALPAENVDDFAAQVAELGGTEIGPPPPEKFSMGALPGASLTANELAALGPFFE